jgi:hypothetical protein
MLAKQSLWWWSCSRPKGLLHFRAKIDSLTAHSSYGAWKEGQHDDLVLAVALAVWFAEHGGGRPNLSW